MEQSTVSIGERIKQRRIELGLTQEELGARLDKGGSTRNVNRYENDRNKPSLDVLIGLAVALETTIDWLVGNIDNPERPLSGETDLTSEEKYLLKLYRAKDTESRQKLVDIAKVV